jgi:hypothetical protein
MKVYADGHTSAPPFWAAADALPAGAPHEELPSQFSAIIKKVDANCYFGDCGLE